MCVSLCVRVVKDVMSSLLFLGDARLACCPYVDPEWYIVGLTYVVIVRMWEWGGCKDGVVGSRALGE